MVLHGRFPPEMAARILSALEAVMAAHVAEQPAADGSQEHSAPPDVPRGTPVPKPPVTARRADELAWMAERVFAAGDAPALAPDRHELVVHVDAEVLAGGGTGRCEVEPHSTLAGETEAPGHLSALVLVEACRHWAGLRPFVVGRSATLRAVRAIVHAA